MRLISPRPYSAASPHHVVWIDPMSSAPNSVMRPRLNVVLLCTRPPTSARASNSLTRTPLRVSVRAAINPASPPPTTATESLRRLSSHAAPVSGGEGALGSGKTFPTLPSPDVRTPFASSSGVTLI